MNALSLAHIAPNEACARRSGPLCATSPRAPAHSPILAMGRLSQSSRALPRALTDRDLSDQVLARGLETALKLLDERA
jgi:hypothetical protein